MVRLETTNKLQEALITYRSCVTCRDKDTRRIWGDDVLKKVQLKRSQI